MKHGVSRGQQRHVDVEERTFVWDGKRGKRQIINQIEIRIFTFSLCQRPPLWSSSQSSWLQIQRSGFDSRNYQIFWDIEGLERGPLNHVSTIEELLGRKSSGSGLRSQEYGRRDPSCWPRGTLNPQKLALNSPKSSGRSVGIVRSRTQATEFSLVQFSWHSKVTPIACTDCTNNCR
jgi:hypothetical protein